MFKFKKIYVGILDMTVSSIRVSVVLIIGRLQINYILKYVCKIKEC